MNIQNLIVCDNKIIFDILDEIKEELNCNLIFKLKSQISNIENLQNYLILTDHKIDYLENLIIINDLPIKINKIIEKINVSFLKKNFNVQSEIKINKYFINVNSRTMYNKKKNINLTEKEILMILYLKKKDQPCSVNELQKIVWKQSSDLETHTVETHIYRLRKKVKDHFKDEKFIISEKDGYKII